MIIVKIRKPFLTVLHFLPYGYPFVWRSQVSFAGYTQPTRYDSSYDFTIPALNETALEIGNVFIDNVAYDEKASEALMVAEEKTFYFDLGNQFLYIHLDHEKLMTGSDFNSLKVQGYSSDRVFYDDNEIEFLPLLTSGYTITESADRLVYAKMAFVTNSAVFDNSDTNRAEFDQFADNPTPGADINYLYLTDEELAAGVRTLHAIYTGFAASDELSLEKYRIKVQDKRAQLNKNIPLTTLNTTDFPNIESKLIGKIIPEGYGDILGAIATCTNGTIGSGNVEYKYATDGTSITTVYVKTEDAWNSVTPVSTDAINCEYVLSSTDARDSSGNPKLSKVDCRLRDIDGPGEIMKDMIERYLGFRYLPEYYNQTQWVAETAYLADIYLYLGEQKPFFEYIEEVQNASDYGFRFRIDRDGKFTLKVDDINRAVSKAYLAIDNISDLTPSKRDFQEYASTVKITYSEDQENGDSSFVIVDDYETEALDVYRLPKQAEFKSNLKTLALAEDKGERLALDYSVARNQITFSLNQIEEREIYDVITVDTAVYNGATKIREYLGVRKLKINELKWDLDREQTTITGYDITGVI